MKKKNRHANRDLKQSVAVDPHQEAGTGKRCSRKELFEAEEFSKYTSLVQPS